MPPKCSKMPPNYSNMPPNLLSPKINTYLSPNCSKMSPIYCINWDYVTVSLEKVTTKCSLGHVCSFVTQLVRKFAAHFSWLNQSSQRASEWSVKWWQIWTQLHMCTSDNKTEAEEVDEVRQQNRGKDSVFSKLRDFKSASVALNFVRGDKTWSTWSPLID